MDQHLPSFVAKGTFTWTRHGYHYAEPPTLDLLAAESLRSSNPWVVVAATLERAKVGDHSHVGALKKWFHTNSTTSLGRVCMLLTGDAGTTHDLKALQAMMTEGPEDARMYACLAAVDAGVLWLVPSMLEAWESTKELGIRETIGYAISDLLETRSTLADVGPIALSGAAPSFDKDQLRGPLSPGIQHFADRLIVPDTTEKFRVMVRSKLDETRLRVGTEQAPVWGGNLFGVTSFTRHLISLIQGAGDKPGLWGSLISLRRKFEASTGIDCSDFFKNDRFQPLSAIAILEEFLESPAATTYQEGVRYFFGHAIPA